MSVENTSGIKAMPINQLATKFSQGVALIRIAPPNLMKESNLIIEPVTGKNDFGLDETLYYKATATIYFIDNSPEIQSYLKGKIPRSIYLLMLGNTGAYTREGDCSLFLGGNTSVANHTIRDETIQGWLRSVLKISAISRVPFEFTDNNQE